jgi:hypothetical protein
LPCAHAVFGDEDLRILGRQWQLLLHDSLHRRIVVGPLRYVALFRRNNDPWTEYHPGIPDEPPRVGSDLPEKFNLPASRVPVGEPTSDRRAVRVRRSLADPSNGRIRTGPSDHIAGTDRGARGPGLAGRRVTDRPGPRDSPQVESHRNDEGAGIAGDDGRLRRNDDLTPFPVPGPGELSQRGP